MFDSSEPDLVPGEIRTLDQVARVSDRASELAAVLEAFLASALDPPHSRRGRGPPDRRGGFCFYHLHEVALTRAR